MRIEFNVQQRNDQADFRKFVLDEVVPNARLFDEEEYIPAEFIKRLAQKGFFGAILPETYGGRGMDLITYGILNEELGRGCASVRSLVMLQNMIAHTLFRWGKKHHKNIWVKKITSGEAIGAFALTEPNVGSDARHIQMSARKDGDAYVISGTKTWVSLGQVADVFLVFAQCEKKLCAFLLERKTPGLSTEPIRGMLGVRGSMLAKLHLRDCRIHEENLVGGVGFGFVPVGAVALNLGRYSIAWGCVGMAQSCLEACIRHTSNRKQFGVYLKEHQLIKKMIADMIVNIKAARLLCYQAGYAEEEGTPVSVLETMVAKYFASQMATRVTNDAVQIHGALGCSNELALERHLRDSKIMEIIEGTTQIHQIKIAEYGYQEYGNL